MTEEDLESDVITPDILPENKLSLFVKEADLEPSMATFLIEKYKDHFKLAAEWAKKAKSIIVTDESQTVNMQMAKTGRLFLRKQRLEIENTRKMLKAGALKECQCIDRLSNFLKDVIIPTEEHLDRQEHFVEYREKAKADAIKLEVEKRMEEERIAKEKADAEALAKAQAENQRLRDEQEKIKKENEVKIQKERAEQQAKLDLVRKEQEAQLAKEREEQEVKLAKERAEREKVEAELRAKKQAEMKAESDRIKAKERAESAPETAKLIKFRTDLKLLINQFPEIKNNELKRISEDAKSYLWLAHSTLNQVNQEEEE